ncbi:MAG: DUF5131 family protein [Candidatus Cloacimonadota bacterium]|nr:MAG: DUF5131 family protein [Candidatus Cloacimonadota bacterium]
MQKSKIEWTDYTWNPIKGLCPHDCWYCYARKVYERFGWNTEMRFELHDPKAIDKLHRQNIPDGSKVFVCSTFELFHPEVPKTWRKDIFDTIKLNPKITFQILTKLPQHIDRPMPDNVWLGVSVTQGSDEGWSRIYDLSRAKAKLKFISFEPLLGLLNQSLISNAVDFDWFIFGRLTGHGKEHDPDKRWIEPAVDYFRGYKKPVFLKNNLKEIWGEPLIQEFPREE